MGLLSKTAIVHPSNMVDYYENKGYVLPHGKRNKVPKYYELEVKVEDLPPLSGVEVLVQCDCCGMKRMYKYEYYVKKNRGGKWYCQACARRVLYSGENSPLWNADLTEDDRLSRNKTRSQELNDMRKMVLRRDKFTCFRCHKSNNLKVHHLNGWNWCIEGRYDPNNCITLCEDCHKAFHLYYGAGNNTRMQFKQWMGITKLMLEDCKPIPKKKLIYCIDTKEILDDYDYFVTQCCNGKFVRYKGKRYIWYSDYLKFGEAKRLDKRDRIIIRLNDNTIWRNLRECAKTLLDEHPDYTTGDYKDVASYLIHIIKNGHGKWSKHGIYDGDFMYLQDYLRQNNLPLEELQDSKYTYIDVSPNDIMFTWKN